MVPVRQGAVVGSGAHGVQLPGVRGAQAGPPASLALGAPPGDVVSWQEKVRSFRDSGPTERVRRQAVVYEVVVADVYARGDLRRHEADARLPKPTGRALSLRPDETFSRRFAVGLSPCRTPSADRRTSAGSLC